MSASVEDAFRSALRADPTINPNRLAKELGLSSRARRRLEQELEAEGVLRGRRRLRVAGVLAAATLVTSGLWLVLSKDAPETSTAATDRPERRPLSPEAAEVERSLYAAIDQRDPAKTQEAVTQLTSPDEPLRLAALRYLVTVSATEQTGAMLPLVDDPSERVRTSAIQLLASFPGQSVDDRLASVLADSNRPIAERSVAAVGLEGRTLQDPEHTARLVLPALLADSLPLRQATDRLLTKLTSRTLLVDPKDKAKLHAAWRGVVGVAE